MGSDHVTYIAVNATAGLCLECGLCCDGTLFPHMRLKPQETGMFTAAGAALVQGDPLVVSQPCTFLSGTTCRVYGDRPHICRRFKCRVLERVERGEIDPPEARRIIRVARALRDGAVQSRIPDLLQAYLTRYFRRSRRIDQLKREPPQDRIR